MTRSKHMNLPILVLKHCGNQSGQVPQMFGTCLASVTVDVLGSCCFGIPNAKNQLIVAIEAISTDFLVRRMGGFSQSNSKQPAFTKLIPASSHI